MITENISADVFENPFFKQFMNKLHPGYKIPTRNSIYWKAVRRNERRFMMESVNCKFRFFKLSNFQNLTAEGAFNPRYIRQNVMVEFPDLFETDRELDEENDEMVIDNC